MTSILRLRTPVKGVTLPTEVQHSVWRDTPTQGEPVAYVEVDSPAGYRAERKLGVRRFRLWGDKDRRQPLAVVTTQPGATKKQATYLVHRASGEPMAAITRERGSLLRFSRTRWVIQLPGQPAVVGYKGKIGWWVGWIERGTRKTAFALNMDMSRIEEAPKRIEIGKTMLARLGVY